MENSALSPAGISAKIAGKPQDWILDTQIPKNNYLIPWRQYMWSMNKMSSSLISLFFSIAKVLSFMGTFNRFLCAYYEGLLLGNRTIGRDRGLLIYSICSARFSATCKNYFYKLKKKLFSISELPNTIVKDKTYFFRKRYSCHHTHSNY